MFPLSLQIPSRTFISSPFLWFHISLIALSCFASSPVPFILPEFPFRWPRCSSLLHYHLLLLLPQPPLLTCARITDSNATYASPSARSFSVANIKRADSHDVHLPPSRARVNGSFLPPLIPHEYSHYPHCDGRIPSLAATCLGNPSPRTLFARIPIRESSYFYYKTKLRRSLKHLSRYRNLPNLETSLLDRS